MTVGTKEQEPTTEVVDELGPVDWIVMEFPGRRFRGEIAPALQDLVAQGTVRVLDLLLIRTDNRGALEFVELGDLDDSEPGGMRSSETALAMLLSQDDVQTVWENLWADSDVRRAGRQLVTSGGIPVQALPAAVDAHADPNAADDAADEKDSE